MVDLRKDTDEPDTAAPPPVSHRLPFRQRVVDNIGQAAATVVKGVGEAIGDLIGDLLSPW